MRQTITATNTVHNFWGYISSNTVTKPSASLSYGKVDVSELNIAVSEDTIRWMSGKPPLGPPHPSAAVMTKKAK